MGATYTRQSSYSDGDTITAAHTNDEFNQLLAAFASSTGHTHNGDAGEGGPISLLSDSNANNKILIDESNNHLEFYVEVSSSAVQQIRIQDGAIVPITDNDIDLGTSSLEFKDLHLDGTANIDSLVADTADINGGTVDNAIIGGSTAAAITGTTLVANTSLNIAGDGATVTGIKDEDDMSSNSATKLATQQSIKAYVDSQLTAQDLDFQADSGGALSIDLDSETMTFTGGTGVDTSGSGNAVTIAIDSTVTTLSGTQTLTNKTLTSPKVNEDVAVTATATELNLLDGVTATTDELNILDGVTSTATELNFVDGSTAGTVVASKAVVVDSNKDVSGFRNLSITGDLTVSGDDITMGTNTSGHLLIADGTNYNPTAIENLSSISSLDNADVFMVVDVTDNSLKKTTRSDIVAGLVTGNEIANVVEDSTPQLGGDLDVNGNAIVSASNGNIAITPNGSGVVRIDGSNGIDMQSGGISIKNSGSESYVRFYCESSNAHYTQLQAAPHSAYSGSPTVVLPASADTLVGRATTDTLTNKSFGDNTSFGDNNITNVGDIALDSISADGTDINVAVSDNSATAFTIKQGSDNYLVIDTGNSGESVQIGTGVSGTAITLGHGTSEVTVSDNLTVTGNLTVSGTTTTVNTTNTTISDNLLELNSGASSNSNDVGIIIQRGSTGNDALFMWDESADKFALGTTTDNASSTGNLNMTTGTLVANIEGDVTGDVTGNVSGTAATVTGAAQSNITSLGTLTTLTVDNIIINGTTIGHTSDTDAITIASNGNVTVSQNLTVTGDLTVSGDDITMGTNTSGHIMVADGTNFNPVAVSGDISMASNGAVTIAATSVENSMLAGSIADSKLNTISTANKVALSALDIDGSSDIGADLTTSDLIVVDDGAGGTNRKAALSRLTTFMTAQGFSSEDPTALAIALG